HEPRPPTPCGTPPKSLGRAPAHARPLPPSGTSRELRPDPSAAHARNLQPHRRVAPAPAPSSSAAVPPTRRFSKHDREYTALRPSAPSAPLLPRASALTQPPADAAPRARVSRR